MLVRRLREAGCVFAEDEAALLTAAAASAADLEDMVERRVGGVPLEHVLGWAEFCGLRIAVAPAVFVPRQRSRFLVTQSAARGFRGAVIVDLCCGSGAVGAAIAALIGPCDLHAVDIDPAAVRCAEANVASVGQVYEGDLFAALPRDLRGRVDVLVANAPYVPTDAIAALPPEARLYEPRVALDGGPDGLDIQRRILVAAPDWLAPGGSVLIETSRSQAHLSMAAAQRAGLAAGVATSDELEATVLIASLPMDRRRN